MKKSPVPLGLNGIYLGKEQNLLNGGISSESKYKQKSTTSTSFVPVSPSSSPPPPAAASPPPSPSSSPPPLHSKPPMTVRMNRNISPSPASSSQSNSSRNQNGIASKNYPSSPAEQPSQQQQQPGPQSSPSDSHKVLIPKVQKPNISQSPPPATSPVPTASVPASAVRPPKSPPPPSSTSPPPEKIRSQKSGNPKESRRNHSPQRTKSPKPEKESQSGGLVGKTLRSQKMELRIRAALETEDGESSHSNSNTSSESGQSQSELSSNHPSRTKIYEPDMNTYGISNGTLANRTKRMLEKQAKIEGVGKNKNPDGSKGDKSPSSPSPEVAPAEDKKDDGTVGEIKVAQSDAPNNSHPEESKTPPNPFPYPYPYPPSPYGYPPYPNSSSPMLPPYGYPPNYLPPGYPPHYPGYYPNYPGAPFPNTNLELPLSQPLNFDIHTLMLAKQLMGLSDQLKGMNGLNFDPNEYYRILSLFQQLTSGGFMDPNSNSSQHLNEAAAAENEKRSQQEEMTRMLQEQIQNLQLQLQQQLEKNELAKKEGRESAEREEMRVREENEEKLRRDEKHRLELLAAEEKQERERVRAQREQEEEARERLRKIREQVELEEREEKERLREIRERIEKEEREERERREKEEAERREKEERERREKEEAERREKEESQAHDLKVRREFAEAAQAADRVKLKGASSSLRTRTPPIDDFQVTPEMSEAAEEHRRRTGKELPRVLYRLVPHRTKFKRANELFESNIHADQISGDDESLHSCTSETIRSYLSKQESGRFSRSSSKASMAESIFSTHTSSTGGTPSLHHQHSLPISLASTGVAGAPASAQPIVVPRQSRFSCDNPLHKTKDDFWIDPGAAAATATGVSAGLPSSPKARTSSLSPPPARTSTLMDAYDNFKNYLRRKSIFSEELPSSESSPPSSMSSPSHSSSSYVPQPLPPINLEKISSIPLRRPKRGSKDDLEIERITSLMSLSAAHLRQVNLTAGPHHRHQQPHHHPPKKSE